MTEQLDIKQIEKYREQLINEVIPNKEEFPWQLYSGKINADLKFLVKNLFFESDLSTQSYLLLNNINLEFSDKNLENSALNYFLNDGKMENLKDWPLTTRAFKITYTHLSPDAGPMQPKATRNCETHTDYYVGPNKFIRFV